MSKVVRQHNGITENVLLMSCCKAQSTYTKLI